MRLSDLFAGVEGWRLAGAADPEISAVCYRSDHAVPGSLFFCVPGFTRDGHDFAPDAVSRGAAALCVERPLELPVAQAMVPSVRSAMGPAAASFYGHPSGRLLTAGITGTNGKTTSAFLTAHLFDHAGLSSGLLGTVERRIGGCTLPAGRTTPEAIDIQCDFAEMVAAGDKAAVMEVSSHALDQGRAKGIDFRAVAFTNLSQDHLDYHKTLDDYFAAKCRLFLDDEFVRREPVAVLNVDDPFGRDLADRCTPQRVLSFSSTPTAAGWGRADLEWSDYVFERNRTRGTLVIRGRALEYAVKDTAEPVTAGEMRVSVETRLVGSFNVANTLTALGLGLALGLNLDDMLAALSGFRGVPGRMESVDLGQDFTVLVDYAHTPDSIRNALEAARGTTGERVIAVVGCGGDRDKGKRPLMGREAEATADMVIITSDNPRSESPLAIIRDITAGLRAPSAALLEPDRRVAIRIALAEARAGDVVMILGKGHETGQEFATETLPFDDRIVAREELRALGWEGE